MVRPAGTPLARGSSLIELPEPTWPSLLRRGLPLVTIESVVPVVVFYGAWRAGGLGGRDRRRHGCRTRHRGLADARGSRRRDRAATAVFVVIQAVVGLAAHSATVYLAQPVVLSVCWALVYFGSVLIGRPLVGVFANVWYPFPPEFRASAPFRREFGMQSVVWGVYCLARAALRLAVLLGSGVGSFLLVSVVSGAPFVIVLALWGVWHARRTFTRLAEPPVAASSAPAV